MPARHRLTQLGLAALALGAVVAPVGAARAAPATDDEVALLERFAPAMSIRTHDEVCGGGERYLPVAVESILGREDVVLRDADGAVVATAPTAADLVPGNPDLWIDMPGNALSPGCDYEEWFLTLDADPAMYGRVTIDDGHVIAQYWFFWVYNQWNDVHEGDWEMLQLDFGETDVAGALTSGPVTYAFAQHEGSEYATVGENDAKLQFVDGTHPVVHAAQGSHASYFTPSRWFGKSGATGFGCDDTSVPVDLLRPELIVLPTDEVPTEGPFAWLAFEGRWGQQERAFNNGPTGPVTKTQWSSPVEWVEEEGRSGAVALPFAQSRATDAFCGLTAWGSEQFNKLLDEPFATIAVFVVFGIVVTFIVRRSSQGLLGRAARRWRAGARRFVPVGMVVLVGLIGSSVLVRVLEEVTSLGIVIDAVGGSSPWVLPVIGAIGALIAVPVLAWVAAATVAVTDGAPTSTAALREPLDGPRPSILPTLVLLVGVGLSLLLFTPLLIICSRWLVAPVVASRGEVTVKQALGGSHQLIKGHGWRAAGLVVTLLIVASLAGVAGAVLLLLTDVSFLVASLASGLAGVVLVPYIALVLIGFHDELAGEPAP